LGAVVDVTERKRADEQRLELLAKDRTIASERALREKEAELARVVRALSVGELASSIAHEVNQPLAGVMMNAEAALRWLGAGTPDLEEARDSLARIAQDANRASAVIRRIREFLKKERQQTALLDVNQVVQESVALVREELLKRQINLYMELSSELPQVRGDPIQLEQVILNLIMNGADAMASMQGGKDLRVRSQKDADSCVVVAVRDSGVGIDPEQIPRMFDAFFTTKSTGMGMGLSISRTIIEAHGGRIWAELNDGPGLTVQFKLAACDGAEAASIAS
jgi:signal transduction histidine kinase